MITFTDVRNDNRIRKEAASASTAHEVFVCSHLPAGVAGGFALDGFRVIDVPVRSRGLPSSPAFWLVKYLEFVARAVHRAARTGSRIYHGHEVLSALPAWLAARLTGGRFVYDAHELELDRADRLQTVGWLYALVRFWVRFLLRRADAVICASEERADIMSADYGVRERPTPIINVTPRGGIPPGPPAHLPPGTDFPAAAVRIVYQGGLTRGRGLANVVDALTHLPENHVLIVVGDGADREAVTERIAAAGLSARVALTGRVPADHVVSYMELGDVGVVIYQNTCRNNYYCAPNKLYDYCAVGVPVIGSDVPGVRGVIDRFDVGELFDPTDPRSIADAVRRLFADPELYARRRATAARLKEELNWEQQQDKLLRLYSELDDRR